MYALLQEELPRLNVDFAFLFRIKASQICDPWIMKFKSVVLSTV